MVQRHQGSSCSSVHSIAMPSLGQPLPAGNKGVKVFQDEVHVLCRALASNAETPLLMLTLQCWEERVAGVSAQTNLKACLTKQEALICLLQSKVLDQLLLALAGSPAYAEVLRAAAAAGRTIADEDVTTLSVLEGFGPMVPACGQAEHISQVSAPGQLAQALIFILLRCGTQAPPELIASLLELLADAAKDSGGSGPREAHDIENAQQNVKWISALISSSLMDDVEAKVLCAERLASVAERILVECQGAPADDTVAALPPSNHAAVDMARPVPAVGSDIWAMSPEDGHWYRAQVKALASQAGGINVEIVWLQPPDDAGDQEEEYFTGVNKLDSTIVGEGCVLLLDLGRPKRWRGEHGQDPLASPALGLRQTNFVVGPATGGDGGGDAARWNRDADAADGATRRRRRLRALAEFSNEWRSLDCSQTDGSKMVATLGSVARALADMRTERSKHAEVLQQKREETAIELAATLQHHLHETQAAQVTSGNLQRQATMEARCSDLTKQQRVMSNADAVSIVLEALLQKRINVITMAIIQSQRLQGMGPSLAEAVRLAEQAQCEKLATLVATLSAAAWGTSSADRLLQNAQGLADLTQVNRRACSLAEGGWRHAVQMAAEDLDPEMSELGQRYRVIRQQLQDIAKRLAQFEARVQAATVASAASTVLP